MSFNIRNGKADDGANSWTKRRDLVTQTIRGVSPDVVCVQEAFRFQLDYIHRSLGHYGEVGVGREGGTQGEYAAILFDKNRWVVDESETFWLSDTPEKPSRHWGNSYLRICTWARLAERQAGASSADGAGVPAFYVFNVHLDHQSPVSRKKSVKLIAERIASRKHPDPAVLMGDFNAGEGSPSVRYLLGDTSTGGATPPVAFVDSFRVLHPDESAAGTFHGFYGVTLPAKIDYILVPPDAKVLEAGILHTSFDNRFPSDHFPVSARVRVAMRKRAAHQE